MLTFAEFETAFSQSQFIEPERLETMKVAARDMSDGERKKNHFIFNGKTIYLA